ARSPLRTGHRHHGQRVASHRWSLVRHAHGQHRTPLQDETRQRRRQMARRRKKKRSTMTSAFAQIPLAVGAGAVDVVGRAFSWGANHFLRSPMASTGLVLVSGLTLLAATNALFLQDERHPAPLFVSGSATPAPIRPVVVEPEAIPQRPVEQPAAERTAAVNPAPD